MRTIRVFPRKTQATPDDELAYFGPPDLFAWADKVEISVAFTADKPRAESLAQDWQRIAPVTIGGPAYETREALYSNMFTPGKYIKPGYVLTSRGCPRKCWFCGVPKLRPAVIPIPINDGWNVLDDNLLACPEPHVYAVFDMLARQKQRITFTGGLEALSLKDYQVNLLASLKPRPVCFFAYDPGDAPETLESAAKRMLEAGWTRSGHRLRSYCLIGYPFDTFDKAESRLRWLLSIGFTPFAMLWQPDTPKAEKWRPSPEWRKFQRLWARPAIIHSRISC